MKRILPALVRSTTTAFFLLLLCIFLFLERDVRLASVLREGHHPTMFGGVSSGGGEAARERLDMGEKECRARFPGLVRDVDEGVKRGKFVLEKEEDDYKGLVQGWIKDNQVGWSRPSSLCSSLLASSNSLTPSHPNSP